jgi:hypothetical protein
LLQSPNHLQTPPIRGLTQATTAVAKGLRNDLRPHR